MLNKIKGIKVECESFLEHGSDLKIDNCSPIIDNNNFNHSYDNNNNNDFLYGLINKLSPDSNISELFSQSSATINDDQCCYNGTQHFPTIENGIVKIDNLSENNNYSIINNGQNYQFLPINNINTNIKLPSLQTSSNNNPYVRYVNDYQYVKNEEFINYQSSIKSIDSSKYSIQKSDNNNIDNIDSQRRRVERKRERNREAARKCREKKNSLIENLEAELGRQRQQIEVMRGKMRLVVQEVQRLSQYIADNIPECNLKDYHQFIEDNDLQQCLEIEKANISTQ